jgi:hypothetical protein
LALTEKVRAYRKILPRQSCIVGAYASFKKLPSGTDVMISKCLLTKKWIQSCQIGLKLRLDVSARKETTTSVFKNSANFSVKSLLKTPKTVTITLTPGRGGYRNSSGLLSLLVAVVAPLVDDLGRGRQPLGQAGGDLGRIGLHHVQVGNEEVGLRKKNTIILLFITCLLKLSLHSVAHYCSVCLGQLRIKISKNHRKQ